MDTSPSCLAITNVLVKINGTIVYPAAGMLVMALEACKQMADGTRNVSGYIIKDAVFHSALIIPSDSEGVETQIQLRPLADSSSKDSIMSDFRVSTNTDGHWSENCRGIVQLEYEEAETEVDMGKEALARSHYYRRLYEEAVVSCDHSVNIEELYDHFQGIGIGYGPTFQALQQASYSQGGEAIGRVRAFQWTADENTNHPQPHIIHPTSLDSLLHVMIVALSRGIEENHPPMMMTRFDKLWLSSSGINYPSTLKVDVYARAEFSGSRKSDAHLFALDQITGNLLLSMEKAEATTVATRDAHLSSQSSVSRLCYDLVWKPDLDLMELSQIVKYCESTRPYRPLATDFYEDLGLMLIMFISNTLDTLVEENCGTLQPHLRPYIEWLHHQLDRFNAGELPKLAPENPKWVSLVHDVEYRKALCNSLDATVQGIFFARIGRNLLEILRGHLDPLAFMFEGDSIPEFYREVNRKVICYEPFNRYLDLMTHSKPGLRVLEIGAGTGATTDFILDALSTRGGRKTKTLSCSQYDYTDISPAFFEAARERYQAYNGNIHFKVLDIDGDPSKQGFESGAYDLILAASVITSILIDGGLTKLIYDRYCTPRRI